MVDPNPVPPKQPVWWKDAAERIFWAALLSVITVAIVKLGDFSDKAIWVPALMVVLTTVKAFVAKHIGNDNTAAIGGNK